MLPACLKTGAYVYEGRIGATIHSTRDGVKITEITEKSVAEKSGLKVGDILKELNGKPVETSRDVYEKIDSSPGITLKILIKRSGSVQEIKIVPKKTKFRGITRDVKAIRGITVFDEKTVSLCIIVSETHYMSQGIPSNAVQIDEWKKAAESTVMADTEKFYLHHFQKIHNFSVVDRNRVDYILRELRFSQTGALSDEIRVKIGQMLGVTHILLIEITRWEDDNITQSRRLIEVETGKVIATDVLR